MTLIIELVENLGLSGGDILRVISTAPARYKVYEIPKRRGGVRVIAQPSRELKAIQNYIMNEKLSAFPVHESALAYIKGKNIYNNAINHIDSNVILKLDFQNFFPSIKTSDWEKFARRSRVECIDISDLGLYSRALFWGSVRKSTIPRCLSIGAPTSPILSNILLYEIDNAISGLASEANLNYTRYADDITISGNSIEEVRDFESKIKRVIRNSKSPKLQFNEEKRGIYTKGQKRLVTGLVITPDKKISIGRDRKRLISAMLHNSKIDNLNLEQKGLLKGLLGFSIANEPEFVERMRSKYGDDVINQALKFRVPSRLRSSLQGDLE